MSDWNYELLPIELAQLQDMNYDLGLLGFDAEELAKLLDPGVRDGLCDPDEVPAPPDEATTRPGDLSLLGPHRLRCGDSSKAADINLLLDGAAIHLVNTEQCYRRPAGAPEQSQVQLTVEGWVAAAEAMFRERIAWGGG